MLHSVLINFKKTYFQTRQCVLAIVLYISIQKVTCVYDTWKWVEYIQMCVSATHAALQNDIYSVKDVCKIVKCGISVKFSR